jgi:hypothetical protein
VPTTVARQNNEARRMFRDHAPFSERVNLFFEFLNTGSCELRTGPDPWPRIHRDLHAPALQLWRLCLELAERMHQASRSRDSVIIPAFKTQEFKRDFYARFLEAAVAKGGSDAFAKAAIYFRITVSQFIEPAVFLRGGGDPYRCVGRCINPSCRNWFFGKDDRLMHCKPSCRESRQAAPRRAAVVGHRNRKRLL